MSSAPHVLVVSPVAHCHSSWVFQHDLLTLIGGALPLFDGLIERLPLSVQVEATLVQSVNPWAWFGNNVEAKPTSSVRTINNVTPEWPPAFCLLEVGTEVTISPLTERNYSVLTAHVFLGEVPSGGAQNTSI